MGEWEKAGCGKIEKDKKTKEEILVFENYKRKRINLSKNDCYKRYNLSES